MNLNQLRIFHTVAVSGSFTRASEKLCLTQPGISKHIKQLEEYYGILLFDRLVRKVALTQAGEILFRATRKIFHSMDEARLDIMKLKEMTGGELSIGAISTIGIHIIPGILSDFHDTYPDIDIKLDITDSRKIVEMVSTSVVDLGLIGSSLDDDRLVTRRFFMDTLTLIMPASHKWNRGGHIDPARLAEETLILPKKGSETRTIVDERLKKAGVTLKKTVEFGNTEAIKKAVEQGMGVSIVSKNAVLNEIEGGVLKTAGLSMVNLNRSFRYIYRKDKSLSIAARAFLDLVNKLNREFGGSETG